MKILQVIPYFSPNFGGPVKSIYNISKELVKRDHNVTIITSDFKFDACYANSLKSIDVIPFKCVVNVGSFLYSPGINGWLHTNIQHFDIIHLHNFRSYQNNQTHAYAGIYGIPYILQARGSLPRIIEKKRLKKFYDLMWGYSLLNDASKLLALNYREAQQYNEFGVEDNRIEIVPNALDISNYEKLPRKGVFREKYRINRDDEIILFVGRLHKIKGIDLLIDAFSDLSMDHGNVKLVLVGPDDGFLATAIGRIKALGISSQVLITGPLYDRDKLSAYVDANIFVLPSAYEMFPNTILEAWGCGTPVIATDRCAISDLVKLAGLVVKYDKNELKDALKMLLDDELTRSKYSKEGKALVRNKFNIEEITTRLEFIYNKSI